MAVIDGALELLTERLLPRPLQASDLPEFVAYRSDPDVARFQGWDSPYHLRDAEALLSGQHHVRFGEPGPWFQVAAIDRRDGVLCGDCAVRVLADSRATAEIGMTLAPARQGRALATEALTAVLDALFGDLALHRVIARIDDRNHAARRLFERLRFRHEARFIEADWFKGGWSTLCVYAVLAREWRAAGTGASPRVP